MTAIIIRNAKSDFKKSVTQFQNLNLSHTKV